MLDSLVLPTDEVIDYYTERTGFEASLFVPSGNLQKDCRGRVTYLEDTDSVVPFEQVRHQAQLLLNNKIIVAYELWTSLDVRRLRY